MGVKEEYRDVWGWVIYSHSSGNLRFSIYDGDKEVCWCRTLKGAQEVLMALKKAEFS